jgi:dTDP-4-amino-4,6-dideoxygalactose transaminase
MSNVQPKAPVERSVAWRLRKLPPVGTRLRWRELAAGWQAPIAAEARLAAALRQRLAAERVYLYGSGRAALAALLAAARVIRPGEAVVAPAYTCWSVAAAIKRAGLRVLPADVDAAGGDFDFERLAQMDWRDVVAVVSPGLFGLPGDLRRLEALAEEKGVVMIDDAAQCFGAAVDGRPAGSFGDAGILSFGRGKNLTALGGGAALVRHPALVLELNKTADAWRTEPAPTGWQIAARGAAMRLALSPFLYSLAEKMPGVRVGQTVYDPGFPTAAMGAARAAVAATALGRLDKINADRAQRAALLDAALAPLPGLTLPQPRAGASPAWLRRAVLVNDPAQRGALLAAWQAAGIGATGMYPAPLAAIPALAGDLDLRAAPFPNAERVAASLIALPVGEGLNRRTARRIADVAARILGGEEK